MVPWLVARHRLRATGRLAQSNGMARLPCVCGTCDVVSDGSWAHPSLRASLVMNPRGWTATPVERLIVRLIVRLLVCTAQLSCLWYNGPGGLHFAYRHCKRLIETVWVTSWPCRCLDVSIFMIQALAMLNLSFCLTVYAVSVVSVSVVSPVSLPLSQSLIQPR